MIPRLTLLLWLVCMAIWPVRVQADPHALPVELRAGPIIVKAEAGLDVQARDIADAAPDILADIARDLPELPTPKRVEIRLVRQSEDLPRVAPAGRGAPPWAVGVSYRGTGVVSVAMRRGGEANDVESTVAHELAHLALDSAAPAGVPRWLNEGFAYLHSSDFSIARAQTLTTMAWSGNVIPISELDDSFPAQELAAHRAYAQSYDLVAFLAQRGRFADPDDDGDRWPFRDFIAAIARGQTVDEAALAAYGTPMSRLFEEWRAAMRDRYMLAPIGLFGIALWALGAVLLILAFLRKRRRGREILRRWEEDERASPPSSEGDWLH